ncbi:hypothetical protein GCM10027445_10750 [Amycolatopsis endophytica]|uniref:Magnesium transporter MgtE intracellular domain-containing protein n=1 Tax=Amycolatopsis endophytica TaxID=860233 RepID=A0A853AXE6_9PSEU|nr:hypothetical protein [Amycolatopsis endophytica]NYI87309.1 hypothetical protein [Amycolatopsis endophytica]
MTPAEAEIRKLARVLGVGGERLAYLADVPVEDLRELRERATTVLFDAHLGVLERMAGASKLLPTPVLAKMAERVFGPLLAARIAGLVEASRGAEIAGRLSPVFLADVAAELDPRRARGIIAKLPAPVVVSVARELTRRQDWVTIARFVDHLPDSTIVTSLEFIPDTALPEVAALLDDPSRIAKVRDLLPPDRLAKLPGHLR